MRSARLTCGPWGSSLGRSRTRGWPSTGTATPGRWYRPPGVSGRVGAARRRAGHHGGPGVRGRRGGQHRGRAPAYRVLLGWFRSVALAAGLGRLGVDQPVRRHGVRRHRVGRRYLCRPKTDNNVALVLSGTGAGWKVATSPQPGSGSNILGAITTAGGSRGRAVSMTTAAATFRWSSIADHPRAVEGPWAFNGAAVGWPGG